MREDETLTHRVIRGSSVVMAFTILAAPLGYLIRIIYSRSLSIESFGLFYAALGLYNILTKYNDLGFGYSVNYLVPKYIQKKDLKSAWQAFKYKQIVETITSFALALILIITSDLLATYYFKTPEAKTVVRILIIYFISDGLLSSLRDFLTGLQKEAFYSSIKFVRQLLILGTSIIFFTFESPNVISVSLAWSIACVLTTIIYYLLFYKKLKKYVKKIDWDKSQFKLMLKFAIPTIMTASVTTFVSQSDILLLTAIKNVREVGIYNIILPIVTIPNIFLTQIRISLFPLISSLMETNKEKLKILINSVLKIIPFVGMYFAVFIFTFPEASIINLFGKKWLADAKIPLSILSLGYVIALISQQLSTFTTAMGKVKENFKISVILAVVNLTLGSISIYYFGIVGLVIANTFIYLLSTVFYSFVVKTEIAFNYPWKTYIKIVSLGIVVYLTVRIYGLTPIGWGQFVVFGAIYTVVFAVFGYLLNIVDKSIIRELKLIITRRKPV